MAWKAVESRGKARILPVPSCWGAKGEDCKGIDPPPLLKLRRLDKVPGLVGEVQSGFFPPEQYLTGDLGDIGDNSLFTGVFTFLAR